MFKILYSIRWWLPGWAFNRLHRKRMKQLRQLSRPQQEESMQRFICQKLLVCCAKALGLQLQEIDLSNLKLVDIRKYTDGVGLFFDFIEKPNNQ